MDKEYSAVIDGDNITFEFKDSLIHAEGDHAGNIDAIITTNPPLPQNLLLDELHIKVPGTDEYLYIYGYGAVDNHLKATFNSSALVDIQKLPDMVEVYWGANGEQFIGEMCCRKFSEQAESELSDEIDTETEEEEESIESEPKQTKESKAPEVVKEVSTEEESKEIKKEFNYTPFIYAAIGLFILMLIYFVIV